MSKLFDQLVECAVLQIVTVPKSATLLSPIGSLRQLVQSVEVLVLVYSVFLSSSNDLVRRAIKPLCYSVGARVLFLFFLFFSFLKWDLSWIDSKGLWTQTSNATCVIKFWRTRSLPRAVTSSAPAVCCRGLFSRAAARSNAKGSQPKSSTTSSLSKT